jgi:hypothetical protein
LPPLLPPIAPPAGLYTFGAGFGVGVIGFPFTGVAPSFAFLAFCALSASLKLP